jgi:hypothetical protein
LQIRSDGPEWILANPAVVIEDMNIEAKVVMIFRVREFASYPDGLLIVRVGKGAYRSYHFVSHFGEPD